MGLPSPTGEPAAPQLRPPAPGAADKGDPGANGAPPQTYRPPPTPQNKEAPPRAGTLGSGPLGVLFSLQGARRTPARAPGTVGDLPLQSSGCGRSVRAPRAAGQAHPRRRSLRPPAPRPLAGPRALTSPRAEQLVGRRCAEPPSGRPSPSRAEPRPRRARRPGAASRRPRAAPAPPSPVRRGRWKVSVPNGGRGRCGGGAGRGRWRLSAPERGEWGGRGGSGGGGRGRDGGRDRHGQ